MIGSQLAESYYRAAVGGLHALERREGRGMRFGPEADARWARFQGKLHEGDRLQLLLRDASIPWGIAFAGASIFRLPAIARDEPFGPAWPQPSPRQAQKYLAEIPGTLAQCAAALGIEAGAVDVPELAPTTQLVVAGGAAVLALAEAFDGREELDWQRQVTVIADSPGPRQLAGLVSVFLGAVGPCAVLTSDEETGPLRGARVISPDAAPACAARARITG